MTAPTWATGPTPFAIDIIADDVTAYFAARGIVAKVLVGAWDAFKADTSPRVIFGLGDGEGRPIDGHRYAPSFDVEGGTARALWACDHRFTVWVAHPPNAATAPDMRAREARALTWRLANVTLAALWDSNGGGGPQWGELRWLHEDQGARTYGGAMTFYVQYPLPILDDAYGSITPDEADGTLTMSRDDVVVDIDDAPTMNVP